MCGRIAWGVAIALLLAAPLQAQYPDGACALRWSGASGAVGSFCWGNSCTPDRVRVVAGEAVELLVRGDWNAPYVLLASITATSCVSFPDVFGSLVLDVPLHVAWTGTCAQASPILACPPGFDLRPFTFPRGIPPGSTIALQAVVLGANGRIGLTGAIVAHAT